MDQQHPPKGSGSGVASFGSDGAPAAVFSSIISANKATEQGTEVDYVLEDLDSFRSNGYNLIGVGNATGACNQTGDNAMSASDPVLDPLGFYGDRLQRR